MSGISSPDLEGAFVPQNLFTRHWDGLGTFSYHLDFFTLYAYGAFVLPVISSLVYLETMRVSRIYSLYLENESIFVSHFTIP